MTEQLPPIPDDWSDPSYYRRNKHGMSLQVNQLYAGIDSPIDPEFPGDAAMSRSSHRLEPREDLIEQEQAIETVAPVVGETATEAVVEEPAETPERPKDRYDQIFAPVLRPEVNLDELGPHPGYDYLFETDETKQRQLENAVRDYEQKRALMVRGQDNYDRLVTKDSLKSGQETLQRAVQTDHGLRTILAEHGIAAQDTDAGQQLRENASLRRDVGLYLLKKMDDMARFDPQAPERIRRNTNKSPDTELLTGVKQLTSREYSAFLALSMLDGTFNHQRTGDPIEHNDKGETIRGQHRMAAHKVIG